MHLMHLELKDLTLHLALTREVILELELTDFLTLHHALFKYLIVYLLIFSSSSFFYFLLAIFEHNT